MGGGSKEQSLSPLWKQFSLKINSFAAELHENFLLTPPAPPGCVRLGARGRSKDRRRVEAPEVTGVGGGSERGRLRLERGKTIRASH